MLTSLPKLKALSLILLVGSFILTSCNPDDEMTGPEPDPAYTIPTTYDFANVSYSGQTTRLGMLAELKSYMKSSRTPNVSLDASKLAGMFSNDPTSADWSSSFDETKQLRSKTFESVQSDFDQLFIDLATSSQSTVPGSAGTAGVIKSNDGTKSYLISANGLDEAQVIEKGLMGACLYYQSTSVYFGAGKMDVDNEEVTEGKGTTMEHHWDEAFGYLGVSPNFPIDNDGLVFWGSYSNQRDDILGCNQLLMDAMIKGRAAISNKDLATRDMAITEARINWELVSVGSALHYLNGGIENFNDKSLAFHGLSEAIGFIYSLKFNEGRQITNEAIDELLIELAGSTDFAEMNLYNTTIANIESTKDRLAALFNLEAEKDNF